MIKEILAVFLLLACASGCKLLTEKTTRPDSVAASTDGDAARFVYLNKEEVDQFGPPAFSAASYGAHCASRLGIIPHFSCNAGDETAPGVFAPNAINAKSRMISLTAHVPVGVALDRIAEERALTARKLEDTTLPVAERAALEELIKALDERHKALDLIKQSNPDEVVQQVATSQEEQKNCLNPNNWGNCRPNTRIGVMSAFDKNGQVVPDVTVSFACRAHPAKKNGTFLYDAAILQTNTKTGETCWFQMFGDTDGKQIPSPFSKAMLEEVNQPLWKQKEITASRRFWIEPIVYSQLSYMACARCHEGDAFIHNSHINGPRAGGIYQKSLLPVEANRALVPYVHLAPGKIPITGNHPAWQQQHVRVVAPKGISDGRSGCTSCHRFGAKYACDTLMNRVDWNDSAFAPHFAFKSKATFALALASQKACCAAAASRNEASLFDGALPTQEAGVTSVSCEMLPVPTTLSQIKEQNKKN